MKIILVLLLIVLGTVTEVSADIYSKSKAINGMGITESWISGKKKREETAVNFAGLPPSKETRIVRIDKGIEWTVDDTLGMYEERTIALAPTGENVQESMEQEAARNPNDKWVTLPKEEEDFCDPELTVLSGKQVIAGYQAIGYQAKCPNQAQTTVWMVPPDGLLKKYEKEVNGFETGYQDEMYKNYSKAEKKMTKEFMGAFGQVGMSMLLGIRPDKLPKHVVLKVDQTAEMADGSVRDNTLIHVLDIKDQKSDPSLFEIPTSYRKVENLGQIKSEMQAKQMMERMGAGGMYDNLKQYAKELEKAGASGVQEPAGSEETGSSPESVPDDMNENHGNRESGDNSNEFDARVYSEENQNE